MNLSGGRMEKRMVLAKKVDHIDIEVRPTWTMAQCKGVALRIANDHNIQVRFVMDGTEECVEPEKITPLPINQVPKQMRLPEISL